MILIDAGNTSLHFAVEKKGVLRHSFRMYHKDFSKTSLREIENKYPGHSWLLCSVVPKISRIIKMNKGKSLMIVGEDIPVPIKCRYKLADIGQDRLVNAYSALENYRNAGIIIDFGSAITIDFISPQGYYEGGFILPGITTYLRSLNQCALLRGKIHLVKNYQMIPKTTQHSISQGVTVGFPLMINEFIRTYRKRYFKGKASCIKVIVTGGEGAFIRKKLDFKHIFDPLLTLKGLLCLSQRV